MKIKLDKKEYEVPDEVGAFMSGQQKRLDAADAAIAAESKTRIDLETQRARADEAEAQLKTLTETRLDEGEIRAAVKARVALERVAAPILGAGVRLDEMSDLDVKKAVIAKRHPKADLKDKDEAYVNARFDAATENLSAEAIGSARPGAPEARADEKDDADARAEKARKAMHEAWKQPCTHSKK